MFISLLSDNSAVSSMAKLDPAPDFDLSSDYETEIIALEEETEQKVSQTMSAIESAVEAWKAAGKRPPTLRTKIERMQEFYNKLVEWEKESLQKKAESDVNTRIKRLREFVEICSRYKKANKKRVG